VKTNAIKPVSLTSILNAALNSIERRDLTSAFNQLQAFENKVSAQGTREDPASVKTWVQFSKQIMEAIACSNNQPRRQAGLESVSRGANGKVHLYFTTQPGLIYEVEASSDLVHWEIIGMTTIESAGSFDFEDSNSTEYMSRFYRVWKW